MAEGSSKLHGIKETTLGTIKETVGSATGYEGMRDEGKIQRDRGKLEQKASEAKYEAERTEEKVKDTAKEKKPVFAFDSNPKEKDKVQNTKEKLEHGSSEAKTYATDIKDKTVGTAKDTIGSVTEDDSMKMKGGVQSSQGELEKKSVKDTVHSSISDENKEGKNEGFKGGSKDRASKIKDYVGNDKDKVPEDAKHTIGSTTTDQTKEAKGKIEKVEGEACKKINC